MVIDAIRKVDEELHEPRCPEAQRKMWDDGPARCKLNNLKTCIRESNPPQLCEYYDNFLKEEGHGF